MKKLLLFSVVLMVSGAAQAALIDRGGGFIYDDVLDITWTQNANINGINDIWDNQVAWAAGLSLYDSVRDVTWNDWRLPTTLQVDPSCSAAAGYCTGSELGHLINVDGIGSGSMGLFINIQSHNYWSGTQLNATNAWRVAMSSGYQGTNLKTKLNYAWAVMDGDVAAVPVPAAAWLFGSALGLAGFLRRRAA